REKADGDSEATDGTEPDEEYDTGSAEEDDEVREKKKKSSSGKKDPNAVKRATSAYFHWMNEISSSITKSGMGVAEVAKKAGWL
uniref:Uncharacterized protein n=1 Tax=Panagrolaimus sp. ES5 TaxID=591445 RepID=A0AC34GA14_9BILA